VVLEGRSQIVNLLSTTTKSVAIYAGVYYDVHVTDIADLYTILYVFHFCYLKQRNTH